MLTWECHSHSMKINSNNNIDDATADGLGGDGKGDAVVYFCCCCSHSLYHSFTVTGAPTLIIERITSKTF